MKQTHQELFLARSALHTHVTEIDEILTTIVDLISLERAIKDDMYGHDPESGDKPGDAERRYANARTGLVSRILELTERSELYALYDWDDPAVEHYEDAVWRVLVTYNPELADEP